MDDSVDIFDSVISKGISDMSADILEVGIDQLIDNEFLKDIPIIGLGIKAYTLTQKISESFFTKKIIRFLFQLKDIPQGEREEFINQLGDKKQSKKAGEKVLTILNRLDDITKASIIGRLFKATILKQISFSDFMRLSHIVDKVFLDDLLRLRGNAPLPRINNDIKTILYQAGLLVQEIKDNRKFEKYIQERTGTDTSFPSTFEYSLNDFGKLLIKFGL